MVDPIAYYPIFMDKAIEILDIEYSTDDWIKFRYSTEKRVYHSKIRYDDDKPFFKCCLGKIYLNECMRINYP